MPELLQYHYRIPVKNVKRKRIYHFSDTHLAEWDAQSSETEIQKATVRTAQWEGGRLAFARNNGEPAGKAQMEPAKFFFLYMLEAARTGDALIMAGDIEDFHTDANARLTEAALRDCPVPFLPVCGNHDEPDRLPEGHPMKSAGEPVQRLDLEDMVILGFDNSQRRITQDQIHTLQAVLGEGKLVMIAMHVPIMTEGNREKLQNCGEYFQLNYDGCPRENLEFVNLIRENARQIIAVVCGHLHGLNVSEVCPGVNQYVSSQGLTGSLSVYEIGE